MSTLLLPETRDTFRTLLDALCLRDAGPTPAIIYVATDAEPIVVSRAAFAAAARRFASALRALGLGPGDLVVIAGTQSLESIYAFWGTLLAGAMPSMFPTLTEKLDPDIYMGSMAELVALSGVSAVFTTAEFAPLLAEHVGCPVYSASALAAQELPRVSVTANEIDPAAIAFLQHSSGTTGLQKGVALSHTAVLNQIAGYSAAIELLPGDVIASWLPLYHDMGLIAGFLLPLVQGIPLVLMSPFDWVRHPALLLSAIHRFDATLTWLPNFAYNHMARRVRERDLEGISLAGMRMFINCSEPVRQDSHDLFLARFGPLGARPSQLAVSYAMAENTFGVTQTPPGAPPRYDLVDSQSLAAELRALPLPPGDPRAVAKASCGPPIPGTAVSVLDPSGAPLAERRVGEIAVRSDCMLTEYYKRPDLQPFRDGWYLTGDRGYVAGGEVYIIGRSKDLIINAGKNVYPQDLEAIVNTVPGVHAGRAVVFGLPDEREGTELIAVVAEVDSADGADHKEIARRIRQEVARQSTVSVSFVGLVGDKWLIKTSSGKIARAANRDKWLAERAGGQR